MSLHSSPKKISPSLGPRRQRICRAATLLVIEPLEQSGAHRPVPVGLAALERFSALMAEEGWPAPVSRLAYDPIYARQSFRAASLGGSGELGRIASALLRHLGPETRDRDFGPR